MGLWLGLLGKRRSLSTAAAEPFLVLHGRPLPRMELREEREADMLERKFPAPQSKNGVPKLLPDFSVTK